MSRAAQIKSVGPQTDGTAGGYFSWPFPYVVFDTNLNCVNANSAFARFFPAAGAGLLGSHIDEVLPEYLAVACKPRIRDALESGNVTENLEVMEEQYGSIKTVWLCTVSPVHESDSVRAGVWLVDVTARTLESRRLLEAERRFRRLTDNARDIIYRMSLPDGRIEYISPSCEAIVGHPPSVFIESLGKIRKMVHPESEDYFREQYQRLLDGHVPDHYEYKIIDTSGDVRTLHQRAVLVRDEAGNPIAIEGIVRDISALKTAEKTLEEHRQKLTALSSRLAIAEEEVRRRVAQDLHDGVAQVLVAARYHLSGLADSIGDDKPREALDTVAGYLERAVEDCRNIALDLSAPMLHEHGLGRAIKLLAERVADRTGIDCRVRLANEDFGLSDEFRIALFQAVRELLTNVEKHAAATEVTIDVERSGDEAVIRFCDNGVGCEGPHRATPPPDGGGFGLFAIREQIQFLGGSTSIECAPGLGCLVVLRAPIET